MNADEELLAVFRAEVEEDLQNLRADVKKPSGEWDINILFRTAHNIKGAARMVGAESLETAAHTLEDLFSDIRDGLSAAGSELSELVHEGLDLMDSSLDDLEADFTQSLEAFRQKFRKVRDSVPPDGQAKNEQKAQISGETQADSEKSSQPEQATVRVSVERVEDLTNRVTELFSLQDRLASVAMLASRFESEIEEQFEDTLTGSFYSTAQALATEIRALNKLQTRTVQSLRESARRVRMVRLDSIKTVLAKAVRDACRSTGKQAELYVEGGSTEIDRGILENLREPLVHLVRNAVAHGIEAEAERVQSGKPKEGKVILSARTEGAIVEIRIQDDGAGIDWENVQRKAAELGLLDNAATPSPGELARVIFHPGFSTAPQVDALSGRGVGLNVVRDQVAAAGGDTTIAEAGPSGTVFKLSLPLTRLTTQCIVVISGDRQYALPAADVWSTFKISEADVGLVDGRAVFHQNGNATPIVSLHETMHVGGKRQESQALLLARNEGERVLTVERVEGQRELSLLPLPWNLANVPYVSACTFVGKMVVPILDTGSLVGIAHAAWSGSTRKESSEKAKRILVVDDSITSRTLERNILSSAGYEVDTAVDGEAAFQMLEKSKYDLVVSDVEMPKCTGIELTRKIRAHSRLARTPLILVTSLGKPEHLKAGADAGANEYIIKGSFDQDELLSAVARLL